MANTEIRRTSGSTPTDAKKFTVSFWFKVSIIDSAQGLFGWRENSNDGNNNLFVRIKDDGAFDIYFTSNNGNDTHIALVTNRLFRDCGAWYHAVISVDSTQSTSSDRVKLYINGVQETSFSTSTYPATDRTFFSNDVQINFGKTRSNSGSDTYFNGVQSHIHFTDGYTYAASSFGSTDATTGEWKINTSPSVTYGNNGFWWLKDNISTTDNSPNSNTFSVGSGTLTATKDNPSNNFATYNQLTPYDGALTYTKGSTVVAYSGSGGDSWTTRWGVSSIGMTAGKYYAEAKVAAIGTNQMYALGLVKDVGTFTPTSSIGTDGVGYYSNGGIFNLSNQTQTVATYTTNDIIGLAFDRDNGTAQWYKNGSSIGNAETGLSTDGTWFFVSNFYSSGKVAVNFGNGVFEETAVSSAGTNASNIGTFEYDVPSGYTALCTKGLNE